MADPPRWFRSIVTVELVLQLPFFFVAAYGFWHGPSSYQSSPSARVESIARLSHTLARPDGLAHHPLYHSDTHNNINDSQELAPYHSDTNNDDNDSQELAAPPLPPLRRARRHHARPHPRRLWYVICGCGWVNGWVGVAIWVCGCVFVCLRLCSALPSLTRVFK